MSNLPGGCELRKWKKGYGISLLILYVAGWVFGLWVVFFSKAPWWVGVPLAVALGSLAPDLATIKEIFTTSSHENGA
jgi:hypothetical protein